MYRRDIICLETLSKHNTINRWSSLEVYNNETVRRLADSNELSLLVDAVELVTPLGGKWTPELVEKATGLLQQLFGGTAVFKKAAEMHKLCGKRWPQFHGIALDTQEFVEGRQWFSGMLAKRPGSSH